MSLPEAADIVVVGAGISGLLTALPLAKAGCKVVVLDKNQPWSDASGANAGTLSVQVKRPEVLHLTRDAIERWKSMEQDYGINVGFGQPGGIRVATTDKEKTYLETSVAEQQQQEIDVALLTDDEIAGMAPWLGPTVKAASFCALDSYSSPLNAGPAIIAGVRAQGAVVEADAKVTAIEKSSNHYQVETVQGRIRCDHVINTAGAWAGDIAAMLDARFPVEVDVNMLSVTEPREPIFDRVVTHAGSILSLKQYPNGTCLIGGGWQGVGSVESGKKEIDYQRLIHNIRVAAAVIPELANLRIVRSWAGFEAVAPDALPVIGSLPGHQNAWVLACARGGYSQAPALGAALAEMILNPASENPWADFSASRFVQ